MPPLNHALLNFLEKIQEKKLAALQNNPVIIKDLILLDKNIKRGLFYTHGEYEGVDNTDLLKETNSQLVTRLLAYMDSLGEKAQAIHNTSNPGNNPNFITRLLMPEFYLYPAFSRRTVNESTSKVEKGPITIENLCTLVEQLPNIAEKYPQNVHLLFSTIPVIFDDERLHPVAIYVQCGQRPIIHVFSKAFGDSKDSLYILSKIFLPHKNATLIAPALRSPEYVNKNIGIDHFYGCLIECETEGGATFYTGIDICADHVEEVVKTLMHAKVQLARRVGASNFFPNSTSYVVSSNTVDLQSQSEIGSMITQADPSKKIENSVLNTDERVFSADEIKSHEVIAPIFGTKQVIYEFPSREVGPFVPDLATQIHQHNKLMIKINALRQYRSQRLSDTELVHAHLISTVITFLIQEIKNLLDNGTIKNSDKVVLQSFALSLDKLHSQLPLNTEQILGLLEKEKDRIVSSYKANDTLKTLALVDIALGLIIQDNLDNQAVKDNFHTININKFTY